MEKSGGDEVDKDKYISNYGTEKTINFFEKECAHKMISVFKNKDFPGTMNSHAHSIHGN